MNLRTLFGMVCLTLLAASISSAALITQCPAVGLDTGCGILITITGASGGVTTAFTVVAASAPTQPPYDGIEDTLVGVLNTSGVVVNTIALSSPVGIFAFDGDGPCTVAPNPGNCNTAEPSGYAGPNVTFSGINAAGTSGTVNFTGGLAANGSAWFGLEQALTASQITPGTPGIPEPGSIALLGSGLTALLLYARRRTAR